MAAFNGRLLIAHGIVAELSQNGNQLVNQVSGNRSIDGVGKCQKANATLAQVIDRLLVR